MKLVKFSLLIGSLSLFAACSKSKDSEDSDSSSEDETSAEALSEGMSTGTLAVQSSGTLLTSSTALNLLSVGYETYSDECDLSRAGYPAGTESGEYGGDLEHNKEFVGCLMKSPHVRGETIIGAVASTLSLLCALGDDVKFDGVTVTRDIELTTDCYPQEVLDEWGFTEYADAEVTASPTDFDVNESGEWDGSVRIKASVELEGTPIVFDQVLLFKIDEENKIYDFATTYGEDATTMVAPYAFGWVFHVDANEGLIRYEGRQQEIGITFGDEDGNKTRHSRVILQGDMDETGAMSSLDDVQLIFGGYNVGDSDGSEGSYGYKTVKGSTGDGMYLKSGSGNYVSGTFTETQTADGCITDGSDCAGNTGIDFDTEFVLEDGAVTELKDWFIDLKPVTFDTVEPVDFQE
jgi:hypothetical protein